MSLYTVQDFMGPMIIGFELRQYQYWPPEKQQFSAPPSSRTRVAQEKPNVKDHFQRSNSRLHALLFCLSDLETMHCKISRELGINQRILAHYGSNSASPWITARLSWKLATSDCLQRSQCDDVAGDPAKSGNSITSEQITDLSNAVIDGAHVIHGDINPGNILLDDASQPRLCDFGLSRLMCSEESSGMTTTTAHTGTVKYLAPELVSNGKDACPTRASNIHAVGCLGFKFTYAHFANLWAEPGICESEARLSQNVVSGSKYKAIPIWDRKEVDNAMENIRGDQPDKPNWLNDLWALLPHFHWADILGNVLQLRFEQLGNLADINDAISNLRRVVELVPDGHPDKPNILSSLGNALQSRFQRLGNLTDIEDAISSLRRAVDLIPDGHPDKPKRHSVLGEALQSRFQRLGSLTDIEDAISNLRRVVELIPDGHPDKTNGSRNLGNATRTGIYIGNLEDTGAIPSHRKIVPYGHMDTPDRFGGQIESVKSLTYAPEEVLNIVSGSSGGTIPPCNLDQPHLNGQVVIPDYRRSKFGRASLVYPGMWRRKPVAVKVLKAQNSATKATTWERGMREEIASVISTWDALKHPNILPFYGHSDDFGDFGAFISMWCEQGTAQRYLATKNPAQHERVRLVRGVCEGLRYLHEVSIVHGDLKPMNILIDEDGVGRISDFGLSKLVHYQELGELTRTTVYDGPERYMAPELFASADSHPLIQTFEGDIYSLGCIMLEFIERLYPFQRVSSNREVIDAILGGLPPALRSESRSAMPEVEDTWNLLEACWSEPLGRPTITTVVETVANLVGGTGDLTPPEGTEFGEEMP